MGRRTRKPIAASSAFWDASALVPLCIRQHNTPQAIAFYKLYSPVVWWTTPVEIASALARLLRMNQISPVDWRAARTLALRLAETWSVIQPIEAVRTRSWQLVEQYDLRAADALQLAAALEWCQGAPRGRFFLAADERLLQAALLAGFEGRRI